jgi:hypothetical protein
MPLHYAAGKPGVSAALIKLLKAKGQNLLSQEGVGTTSPQGKFVAPDPAQAAGDLRLARQQAQEVQGVDPLAAKQRLDLEQKLGGPLDDGTNPFSKDLDTFPDDALSDPADVGLLPGADEGAAAARTTGLRPGRSIEDDLQKEFSSLTPPERMELDAMEKELMEVAAEADARHFDDTGQTIDSNKEYMSADIDNELRMNGIKGVRFMHKEHLGKPVDISEADKTGLGLSAIPDLGDDIPF